MTPKYLHFSQSQESLSLKATTPREQRQYERRKLVEKFCKKSGLNEMPDPFHIAVIPSLKILYCVMPKAASRQWRRMLYSFNKGGGRRELRLRDFPADQPASRCEKHISSSRLFVSRSNVFCQHTKTSLFIQGHLTAPFLSFTAQQF